MFHIYGQVTDAQGRCVHYHSLLDVVANKCAVCGKFYACYQCHDEAENHPFGAVSPSEPDSVMCGVCGATFSYEVYAQASSCPVCQAGFNPRCSLHKCVYSKQ